MTTKDYEVISSIGSGTFGTCKKIRRKSDGKVLVWKEIDFGEMSDAEKQLLVSEVNLLRGLKHEYIVRYFDRIVERSSTTIYIIMEFCEGGDLGSLISKCKKNRKFLDEDFIWKILKQVTFALQECHKRVKGKAILHRDLKPANVFLDQDHNVKLGDFGLARVLNHDTSFAKTFVGTPYYMSPEQMNHSSYNEKSDIWSLGCVLYESCSLSPPFTAPNQKILATRIMDGRFKRLPSQYSNTLNDIVSSMLRVNPILRPSIAELLHHPKIQAPVLPPRTKPPRAASPPPAAVDTTDIPKRPEDALRPREIQLVKEEQELDARERQLEMKERAAKRHSEVLRLREIQLKAREQGLDAREKQLDITEKRMESLKKAYQQMKTNDRAMELFKQTDCQDDDKHPRAACAADHKGRRRVHFVGQGKENGPQLTERNQNDDQQIDHKGPTDLQQRLYNAKVRSAALKQIEKSSKYKSKQLLSMR